MRRALPVLLMLTLAGCSLIPAYQRPSVPLPAQWSPQTAQVTDLVPDAWWTLFASPALDDLVTQALAANQDLAAAVARISQARAAATIAGAGQWPQVDATLSTTDTRRSGGGNSGSNFSTATQNGTRTTAQLSVAYELDLFGRVAATREAARSRVTVSQFDLEALRLVTIADVTQASLNLAATGQRARLAQANLDAARAVLAVLEAQLAAGRVSALERDQQRTVVATSEASLAALAQTEAGARNQLALLTGAASPAFQAPDVDWPTLALPAVTPTVPAALLTRRPDLRRAEADLMAAGADIGAARAALYPSVQIGWDQAWTRSPSATLTTLSASALAPLFRGGALRGEVARTQARREELVANYRQAVLTAYREVSDALDAQRQSALRSAALDQAALAARAAYDGARARFDAGAVDYSVLLDAQRSLISADDAAVSARLDRFTAAVSLYRALGGGSPAQEAN
jgi:NodT family efflux transporter outer membrane factor (OMF) lipoprotein